MVQDWTRDTLTRHQSFPQPRGPHGPDLSDQRRFYEAPETFRHQPPMAIDTALRSHCGIWAKQYFVAVLMDDGTPTTFFSPGQKLNDSTLHQFFNPQKFQQIASQIDRSPNATLNDPSGIEGGLYFRPTDAPRYRGPERRQVFGADGSDGGDETSFRFGRKRQRPRHPIDDEDDVPPPVVSRRGIRINDSKGLWNFYDQRFKSCQQSACKLIAKAWVKLVEPKKQSTHPYTGSDEKAPDWWPKPWGTTKEDKVRHKEPDHLYKRERVHLLNHILGMIVEPNENQHPDIRKLNLSVKKLEECTHEALSGFFAESNANASKKQYLNEIFRVARQQERFKKGEIDGVTEIYVVNEERFFEQHTPEHEEGSFPKEDEEQNRSPSNRSSATQGFMNTPTTGHSPTSVSHGGSFLNELPMRTSQQQQGATLIHDLAPTNQHGYVEDGMQVNGNGAVNGSGSTMGVDIVTSPHEASRRASMFSEYSNMGNNSIYSAQWSAGSAPPNAQSIYAGGQGAQPAHPQPFVPSVPVTHSQPYVTSAFVDGLNRQGYDPSSNPLFRPADMPQASVHQSQGYGYLQHDGRNLPSLPGVSEVIDSVPRGHI